MISAVSSLLFTASSEFTINLPLSYLILKFLLYYIMTDSISNPSSRICSVSERAKLHIAMTVVQFGYAGNHIVMRVALNVGINKLVFLIYRNTVALLLLSPLAYFLEKEDRPALNPSLLLRFFVLGFIGVVSIRGLYIIGLDNTTPVFASAIENAVPAVTFLLASIFRIEEVHLNRKDGIAKILGTLFCAIGALIITMYKGPALYGPLLGDAEGKNWTFGCICLTVRCLCWATWSILQAPTMKKYPAPISVASFTFLCAVLQFSAMAAVLERDPQSWKIHSQTELFSLFYAGVMASGLAISVQIWVIGKGGPMLATAYLPLQTLLVSVMASFILDEEFYLGSGVGGALVMAGLYMVVWGKIQESKFASEKALSKKISFLVDPLLLPTSSISPEL